MTRSRRSFEIQARAGKVLRLVHYFDRARIPMTSNQLIDKSQDWWNQQAARVGVKAPSERTIQAVVAVYLNRESKP